MSIHLAESLEHQLNELAGNSDLSADQHAERAVEQYLLWRSDFVDAVKVGLAEAKRGECLDHDDLVDRIERRLAS